LSVKRFLKTPRNIAIVSSTGAGIILYLYLFFISPSESHVLSDMVFVALTIGLVFVMNHFLLKFYLQDRIKLVYRNILEDKIDTETDKSLKHLDLKTDVIADVNNEVTNWVSKKNKEIKILKEMETFRKDFIGNVSHELKTPIFNIQGYIVTLLDGGLEDESINRKFLERAQFSVERMITLVEDLDLITRLESSQIELKREDFDLVELVRLIFTSLEIKAKDANNLLVLKDPDRPIFVNADQSRIRQVLVNLIINSLKYGSEQEAVTEVRFFHMDNKVLVEVADNGIGIPKEHLPRLFERFYRTDKSRSRDKGGSGLGLSIVKHIIEAHHENINVRSTEGVGSTFSFTLRKSDKISRL
jgi:two-component system, OmpR family, phosphate regulon sensor histidine kinase PhoR